MTGSHPKVKIENGKKVYGPYKGSEQNGGRPVEVIAKKVGKRTVTETQNAARHIYEEKSGNTLPKNVDVDHKNNKGRKGGPKNDTMSNLDPLSHGANVAKENKVRTGTKHKKASK